MSSERSAETSATSMGNAHGASDESLVEAAQRGHSTAFDTLSERYRRQLFCVTRRITRSSEDAEDAVQDTLLRAFVHMRDFDCGQGTAVPRQERAPQVNDPKTGAPTSVCRWDLCFARRARAHGKDSGAP